MRVNPASFQTGKLRLSGGDRSPRSGNQKKTSGTLYSVFKEPDPRGTHHRGRRRTSSVHAKKSRPETELSVSQNRAHRVNENFTARRPKRARLARRGP